MSDRTHARVTERREWARFHDPKSLILALVGEVGELAELFQWLPAGEARELTTKKPLATRAGEEMAGVAAVVVGVVVELVEQWGDRWPAGDQDRLPAEDRRGGDVRCISETDGIEF